LPDHVAGKVTEIVYAHFEPGEDLLGGLKQVAAERKIETGVVFSITGALTEARLSAFPAPGPIETTAIDYYTIPGPLEASGHGIIGFDRSAEEPYVHVHLTVASRQETVMGHLEPGTIVRSLLPRSKFTVALGSVDGARLDQFFDQDESDARGRWDKCRDSKGWPVEPWYHVLRTT
jgi:predicted DNA-binding protein with PD1-like motif